MLLKIKLYLAALFGIIAGAISLFFAGKRSADKETKAVEIESYKEALKNAKVSSSLSDSDVTDKLRKDWTRD